MHSNLETSTTEIKHVLKTLDHAIHILGSSKQSRTSYNLKKELIFGLTDE